MEKRVHGKNALQVVALAFLSLAEAGLSVVTFILEQRGKQEYYRGSFMKAIASRHFPSILRPKPCF